MTDGINIVNATVDLFFSLGQNQGNDQMFVHIYKLIHSAPEAISTVARKGHPNMGIYCYCRFSLGLSNAISRLITRDLDL